MIYALTTDHPENYIIGQPNCTHITLMFWILFLFVSAKLTFCLGWCNIPASCSDCGYCVFHWKQRRKIILQQTEFKNTKKQKKKKQEWVPFLLLSSVNVFSYQRIIKKSQTVSMYCTEYRYRYKCCIWPSLFISWFLCCKPSVCGTVLKRHNMFWSCVDCRTSKEQSFMSLFFVHTETVKHSLINTHLPRAHFILVLFIATPLSLNILQINCYYILYHCVDLKLNGKNEVAKLWKWKCYVLVFAEGGTHLICFLNKAFHSWRQMDTWSYTRMVYEAYPLYCQIFY